jgi:hypothetical protein
MGTGQTILTVGAIVLLGTSIVSVNRTFTNTGTALQQTEIAIYATTLGTSLIEEAQGKAFDENTMFTGAPLIRANMTPGAALGPEGGELYADTSNAFDDFDDYNGFRDTVSVTGVERFLRTAEVFYVNTYAPDTEVPGPTWLKKMIVTVTTLTDTTLIYAQLERLSCYWSTR